MTTSTTTKKLTRKRWVSVSGRVPGTKALGLKVRRKLPLIERVRAGFDFEHVVTLQENAGLSREIVARFLGIPIRTLARRKIQGKLNAEESDRLLRASRIFERSVELFEGDVDQARHWLLTANSALGGASPLEFASTEIGAHEVENLIGRLEHGVFV